MIVYNVHMYVGVYVCMRVYNPVIVYIVYVLYVCMMNAKKIVCIILRIILRISDPFVVKVNEVVKKLEQTISKFFNLQTQITSGITFYTNLQVRYCTVLYCTVHTKMLYVCRMYCTFVQFLHDFDDDLILFSSPV